MDGGLLLGSGAGSQAEMLRLMLMLMLMEKKESDGRGGTRPYIHILSRRTASVCPGVACLGGRCRCAQQRVVRHPARASAYPCVVVNANLIGISFAPFGTAHSVDVKQTC